MNRRPLKQNQEEVALFQRRALVAFLFVLLALGALGTRYFLLQVVDHQVYASRSDRNRIAVRPLPPSRGLIYDRNGVLLADNRLAWRLELIPERAGDLSLMLAELGQLVALDADTLERFEVERRARRSFERVPLKLKLSEEEVARFTISRFRFPGVDAVPYLTRFYPHGEQLAHVLGYVGRVDAADLERIEDRREYAQTTHIGKTGIEAFYERELHGRIGQEQVETNAQGRVIRELERQPAQPGQNLYLSIDLKFQQAAIAAFEGRPGAAVAIDPRNGEILAMVTLPSFDNNLFVSGISHAAYRELLEAPRRPLFNRALQGGYAPGSTLKPFVGLAGLAEGLRRPEDAILSTGAFRLQGQERPYRDWKVGGHGYVDLREALAQSANTYFYQLALDLGIDRLSTRLAQFGFGQRTGIDLRGESSGVLPSRQWKQNAYKQPWYPGETVICGIGQGYHVVTPLQLAVATAQLAMGGRRMQPHLLRARQGEFDAGPVATGALAVAEESFRPSDIAAVREGMEAVLHAPTGTARAVSAGIQYRIAGKTGTAQTFGLARDQVYDENRVAENLRHQALFMGFAPADDPQIALAVVVEHGGSGSKAAAPVARRIFDAWLAPSAPPAQIDESQIDSEIVGAAPATAAADGVPVREPQAAPQ